MKRLYQELVIWTAVLSSLYAGLNYIPKTNNTPINKEIISLTKEDKKVLKEVIGCNKKAIARFEYNKGTLNYALAMHGLEDKNNQKEFYCSDIVRFHGAGGTIDEAVQFLKPKDHDGYSILSGNSIADIKETGGTTKEVKGILEIMIEGETAFSEHDTVILIENKGTKSYAEAAIKRIEEAGIKVSGRDIAFLKKYDISIDYFIRFAKEKNTDGKRKFSNKEIIKFKKYDIGLEYVLDFAKERYEDNRRKFSNKDIALLGRYDTSLEYTVNLEKDRYANGEKVFSNKDIALLWAYRLSTKKVRMFAKEIEDGKRTFPNDSIMLFGRYDVNFKFVMNFAKEKRKDGSRKYTNKDIARISHGDGTLEYCNTLESILGEDKKSRFDSFEISRFAQLRMTIEEVLNFKDTKKPNAIIIYPRTDANGALENEGAVLLFNKIKESYDVWVRIADTEKDVYNAIDKVPDAKLLLIAGHGTRTTLSLGENDLQIMKAEKGEQYTLDIYDTDIKEHLENLNKNAVIFLLSCSNAKDYFLNYEESFADFIIRMAEGRKVIASTESFESAGLTLNSPYPFDISITGIKSGKDSTYTNK